MFDVGTATLEPPAPALCELPLELIERRIEEMAARISAGSAAWLELVAEFDRREGWANTGCRTTAEWVAWRCALLPRAAREQVRVARALRELVHIKAAFASGELSYSKARALTRVADAESEADLLELARFATAAQLERMVRAARRATAAEANEARRECFLRWQWDPEDGCLEISAKLAPEDGALFIEALEAARGKLREQRTQEAAELAEGSGHAGRSGSAEPPPLPAPSNAECLAAITELALARPPSGFNGLAGGERQILLVHIDAETLVTDSPGASLGGPRACAIARGPGIAAETARRLACDSALVPLVEQDGEPIAIGRQRRSIAPAIRRALAARDGCCQFPGCERHRFVDAHHIEHWAHGGPTTLDNLVLLCRHHHRLLHEGGFSIERAPDRRLTFHRPDGAAIAAAPVPPRQPTGARLPDAKRLLAGDGGPINVGACVEAVLTATRATAAPG